MRAEVSSCEQSARIYSIRGTAMAVHPVSESMIHRILSEEASSTRFEDLCVELFTSVDGIEYVRTSRSWDLGQDGRASSPRTNDAPSICCSLTSNLNAKAKSDLERI